MNSSAVVQGPLSRDQQNRRSDDKLDCPWPNPHSFWPSSRRAWKPTSCRHPLLRPLKLANFKRWKGGTVKLLDLKNSGRQVSGGTFLFFFLNLTCGFKNLLQPIFDIPCLLGDFGHDLLARRAVLTLEPEIGAPTKGGHVHAKQLQLGGEVRISKLGPRLKCQVVGTNYKGSAKRSEKMFCWRLESGKCSFFVTLQINCKCLMKLRPVNAVGSRRAREVAWKNGASPVSLQKLIFHVESQNLLLVFVRRFSECWGVFSRLIEKSKSHFLYLALLT